MNYKDKNSVLSAAVGKYRWLGYYLEEPDKETVHLYFESGRAKTLVATFYQVRVTFKEIETACEYHWQRLTDELARRANEANN